jgi:hypothetical protein
MRASAELIEKVGGHIVGIGALVELTFLNGRESLGGHNVVSLLQFWRERAARSHRNSEPSILLDS